MCQIIRNGELLDFMKLSEPLLFLLNLQVVAQFEVMLVFLTNASDQ